MYLLEEGVVGTELQVIFFSSHACSFGSLYDRETADGFSV